jgi:hypothetical protein
LRNASPKMPPSKMPTAFRNAPIAINTRRLCRAKAAKEMKKSFPFADVAL